MTTALAYPVAVRADGARRSKDRRCLRRPGLRLLMRAHEALLHRQTFVIESALRRSEGLSAAGLGELRLAKLRRLVGHAAVRCPYYRQRHLPPAGSVTSLRDLSEMELLTRNDIRQFARRMCWANAPGRLLIGRTHATSDEPLAFFWNRHRQAWDKANRLRAHHWQGFAAGDRELHLWPLDPPHSWSARLKQWLRDQRDDLFSELQIDSLHALNERLPLAWRAWREFDPVRVTAYPSALTQFLADGRRVGCRIGNPSLQRVFLTGEVTFDWQRRFIERELGVPTIQDYGIQEVGALAYACPYGSWHVSAESVIIEIIRHGRPAKPGEYGEVVATALESLAMPVLRYCTGDIVRIPENWGAAADATAGPLDDTDNHPFPRPACRCGRALPIMPPVLGRAADFLQSASGTWVEPARVLDALGEVLERGAFQVVQARDGSIEVRVAGPATQAGGQRLALNWEHAVQQRLEHLVGAGVRCVARRVPSLSRSLFGKCRYVSSELSIGGLARP